MSAIFMAARRCYYIVPAANGMLPRRLAQRFVTMVKSRTALRRIHSVHASLVGVSPGMEFSVRVWCGFIGFTAAAVSLAASTGCGSTAAAPEGGGGRGARGGGGATVPVVVGRVVEKDVPVDLTSIGNVEAFSTISVRAQVTGALNGVRFKEGDYVKKGDLLFTIDSRPYEAALHQAEANLTRDQALLAQAQAQLARDIATQE